MRITTRQYTRCTQAVILAGGEGTRLRPLTDTLPKPMISFNEKPFLEYLIEMLKEQGFEKILLLLGYLPDVVQNYFGDGSSFGIQIEYSTTDVENETGRRIKLAEHKLDSCFLLMYCDNYWPINIKNMWEHFLKREAAAQITVYTNKDKYTRDNVRVDTRGKVVCYDKSRSAANLKGVEIGFAIIPKEVLTLLPHENVNFEKTVYPVLVENNQLFAYTTEHRYYSVGSHERLPLTESFFQRCPAIILDRDGVLNKKAPKGEYITSWDEFEWLPGAQEALRLLTAAGYTVIIVTNQAGIARGMMTESDLTTIHGKMKEELSRIGASIDAIYHCPHMWDEDCECRKPRPGMLFQAQKDFHIDLSKIFFIGDDIRDQQAGDEAECKTLLVSPDVSLLHLVREKVLTSRYAVL